MLDPAVWREGRRTAMQQWFSRSSNRLVGASGLWVFPDFDSWCCMSSAFRLPVSILSMGPLLLLMDAAHVVSKCGSRTGCTSGTSLPFCFTCESSHRGANHASWLQRLHTLNEKGQKVTEMILLKACTYEVDQCQGTGVQFENPEECEDQAGQAQEGVFLEICGK